MNERTEPKIKYYLTEDERDLIESIRNFRKSYPNGYPELLWYVQELFDKLIDPFDDNE
jgi:hypothetical protein